MSLTSGANSGQVATGTIELLRAYQQTLVVTRGPHGWRPVADWCRLRGRAALVLTAWNPGFMRPDVITNVRANEAMATELSKLAAAGEVWPADGRAIGQGELGRFHEPGFCVWGVSPEAVVAIAERFGQFAIFAYDALGVRSLVPCRSLLGLMAGSEAESFGKEPDVDPLYLIAVIKPKSQERDRAAEALAALQVATRAEPGCEVYDLVVASDAEDTWLLIEKWSSKEHWDAHMSSERVAAMGRLEGDLVREPTELRFYSRIS